MKNMRDKNLTQICGFDFVRICQYLHVYVCISYVSCLYCMYLFVYVYVSYVLRLYCMYYVYLRW